MNAKHLIVLLILFWASAARAADFSLPLRGYYRPGKFIPVQLPDSADTSDTLLHGDGIIPTRLPGVAGSVIAPLLVLDASEVHCNTLPPLPLKRLDVGQRLVASQGELDPIAQRLFPDKKIIPIQTEFTGPPAAWESLDALLLESEGYRRIGPYDVAILLAAGTTLAVRSPDAPDSSWPWQHDGAWWIARIDIIGPVDAREAFTPVQGCALIGPARFERIMILALIISIALAGASLLRTRLALTSAVGVSLLSIGLLAWWRSGYDQVIERGGDLLIQRGRLAQIDTWTYLAAPHAANASTPFNALTKPFFEQQPADLELLCGQSGSPKAFQMRLLPTRKIAFLSRYISIFPSLGAIWPASGPMLRMAQRAYQLPGVKIAGQTSDASSRQTLNRVSDLWNTLVIETP